MTTISIVECPRDAWQGFHDFIPTGEKIKHIKSLMHCGFHTIDAGSFVSPRAMPQMADAQELFAGLEEIRESSSTQLLSIVASEGGAKRAAEFNHIDTWGYPFSVSEVFQERNSRKNIERAIDDLKRVKDLALHANVELVIYLSMAFGNPYGEFYHTRCELFPLCKAFAIVIPLIVILIISFLGFGHVHHMFHWMVEGIDVQGHPNYDAIIAEKTGFLSPLFFSIRAIVYTVGWIWAAKMLRKNSLLSDSGDGVAMWKKNRGVAAAFTVFYAVTSSTSAWDFIMSIDTHWFSTLFGWYTFAGMFVSSFAALILITLYLKGKGHMEWINENHMHDLGKFMFAFSVFWTYLWFSQFMLIWYADIPEEVTYYMQRFDQYKVPFFTMLTLNFLLPVLAVLSRPAKRVPGTVVMAAFFVLVGHYMDHYVMIMPGTVGDHYGFGLLELGAILFFTGLFIIVVLSSLAKAPLLHKNHPMITESKYFQQ